MTLGISMLKNSFPLHTKTQRCHSSVAICNARCHTVNTILLLMLTNSIMLAMSKCNTLKHLGIWFRPFANNVSDIKGRFTPWTMKSDHGRWPFPWSDFLKNHIYKAFGPLTRCKPNVDQEGWPCTKKWTCWFFF